jgi:pimeloyl-ACP methyl ester carboxylesterase
VQRAVLAAPLYRPPEVAATWDVFERSRRRFNHQIKEGLRARLTRRPLPEPLLDAMVNKALDRIGPAGFLAVFDTYMATAELPLGRVVPQTLVLGGPRDPSLRAADAVALADRLPSATLVLDERYDHFFHLRQARSAGQRTLAFLGACAGEPAHDSLMTEVAP